MLHIRPLRRSRRPNRLSPQQNLQPNQLRLHRNLQPNQLHPRRSLRPNQLRLHRSLWPNRLRLHRSLRPNRLRLHRSLQPNQLRLHRNLRPNQLRLHRSLQPNRLRPRRSLQPSRLHLHILKSRHRNSIPENQVVPNFGAKKLLTAKFAKKTARHAKRKSKLGQLRAVTAGGGSPKISIWLCNRDFFDNDPPHPR
jgi:hypothetical protein